MYAPTFISASPPVRYLTTSTTTPFMIAAPKRRGRPPKHPSPASQSFHSQTRRCSSLSNPQPERVFPVSPPIGIVPPHQHNVTAEQAALAVLEQNPHLLSDNHTLDLEPPSKPQRLRNTKRRRSDKTEPPLSPRSDSFSNSPAVTPLSPINTESLNPRKIKVQPAPADQLGSSPVQKATRRKKSSNTDGANGKPEPVSPRKSSSTRTKTAAAEQKNEPGWSSSSSSDNTVRWYLKLIGGDRLLRPEEEVELGRKIRDLMAWQRKLVELADTIGREPTVEEWAQYLDEDPEHFKKRLLDARRAKDRMVVCNLRLVVSIAKRYLNRGMPLSDLIQEGTLGLIRACEKFDAEKGFKFSTYATWWVRQAVSRSIADQSRTIRLPVHLYDTITSIRRATKYLTNELGRPPLEQEIAEYCNITVEKLRATRVNMQAAMPLDCPLSASDDALTLSDVIESGEESPEDRVESSLLRDDLEHVVNSLTPRERDVVRMRYGLDDGRAKTLEEIGRVFYVTKERVRQIESKALRKLRHPYRSAVLREYTPPEL